MGPWIHPPLPRGIPRNPNVSNGYFSSMAFQLSTVFLYWVIAYIFIYVHLPLFFEDTLQSNEEFDQY
jgi:hypothetical protein